MLEILRMQLGLMLGGKRKWLVAVCLVLPVLLTVASVGAGGLGELQRHGEPGVQGSRGGMPTFEAVSAIYLFLLYPQAICLLLALFYGTSVLGDELDGKTLTYLFTRPMPRWQFVVGKYLGIVVALIPPTLLSLLASWLILGAPGGLSFFAGELAGTIGALLAYNALFVLFGFWIPRRAMITALLYGIFFELILSFVPALVNEFTITYYLRSLVVAMLDIAIPPEISRMVGGATGPLAVVALLGVVVGSLALSSILAARREYVVKDTA